MVFENPGQVRQLAIGWIHRQSLVQPLAGNRELSWRSAEWPSETGGKQIPAYTLGHEDQGNRQQQGCPVDLNAHRCPDFRVQSAKGNYKLALDLGREIRKIRGVADVFIPQDLDQPALKLEIDRVRACELGLSQREVVSNVITALTSNQMIAPSLWIDPRNGNPYYIAVQYPEKQVKNLGDLRAIPLRGPAFMQPTRLDMVSTIERIEAPTEINHYQIRRKIDVFVRSLGEDLSAIANQIDALIANTNIPKGVEITLRGMVQSMRESFKGFAAGLLLSVLLLYLILVAQFRSFIDPFIILLGEGSEAYAPLARALIGGLAVSVICTAFIVPAGFYLAYRGKRTALPS
jgi:multidrug efflux pump subunit AcrB